MVKTYWVDMTHLILFTEFMKDDTIKHDNVEPIRIFKLSEVKEEIDNRIDYYSKPKPENIEITPKEITISTEDMFKFNTKLIIEELNGIKKRLGI